MTQALSADEQALPTNEIFEVTSYAQRQPIKREFKPWHKPRKQVVREEQWGQEVNWLLGRKGPDDRSLRYLGLPGADLLDLRYLYDRFCRTGDHELTFLGFDESAVPASPYREALNISLSEVRSLEYVDNQSNVLGDDFRRLADNSSIAWDTAQRLGPFDVINIDLCDHLARDEPIIDLSIYNAIYQLCGLQQRRLRPWTLFLTSRINRKNVAEDALARLLNSLRTNADQCAAFATAFGEDLGIIDLSEEATKVWDDSKFYSAITVALVKWVLGFAQPMRNALSISSTIGYRVWPAAPYLDMMSIVLRFEPAASIPADKFGLASASPVFPDECDQAAKLPQRVSGIVDIDEILEADNELWQLFREKAAQLLQQARYDPAQYRKWADEQRGSRGS
jgi:hypothetical protein